MAKTREQERIQLKFAIAFARLLQMNIKESEEDKPHKRNRKKLVTSLSQLSIDTEFRPATLSNIFLGRSNLKAHTINLIITSLGRSYTELGQQLDSISEKEIIEFKKKIEDSKKKRGRPKRKKD
jgi:hypothetical protein